MRGSAVITLVKVFEYKFPVGIHLIVSARGDLQLRRSVVRADGAPVLRGAGWIDDCLEIGWVIP